MKKPSVKTLQVLVSVMIFSLCITSCKKTENPVKFPKGAFPDSTIILDDLNSQYDDLEITNIDLVIDETDPESYLLFGNIMSIISSNRTYTGEQYDLIQGQLHFNWDQTSGEFTIETDSEQNAFLSKLIDAANTTGDDLGPYRRVSTVDGYEYMILSSGNQSGEMDFYYFKNQPANGSNLPVISGPYPVQLLNTGADDAYLCMDTNMDTAYFSTDIDGNFDIFLKRRPAETNLTTWFNSTYEPSVPVDSINSSSDDKCPMVCRDIMVFASDRPGGMGGYDLYYSKLENGKWNSPVNFGPKINTHYDEYRPVIGSHADFSNYFLVFSSNRPGGKGLYDLYFAGVSIK
jgi:hypothetical protein